MQQTFTANLLWTWLRTPLIEFEWIAAIEVFENLRGGKGAVSVILEKRTCCDLNAFISFLAISISLFFDVGNEEDCS